MDANQHIGWIQHRKELRALAAEFGPMRYSIASIVAALIVALGLVALLGVTLRM
jgi:putative membrane protein